MSNSSKGYNDQNQDYIFSLMNKYKKENELLKQIILLLTTKYDKR